MSRSEPGPTAQLASGGEAPYFADFSNEDGSDCWRCRPMPPSASTAAGDRRVGLHAASSRAPVAAHVAGPIGLDLYLNPPVGRLGTFDFASAPLLVDDARRYTAEALTDDVLAQLLGPVVVPAAAGG